MVWRGPNRGERYRLRRGVTILGRDASCDIVLSNVSVSRRHAEIVTEPGGLSIRDLSSMNGTYLNGQRVDSAVLEPGDEIQVGLYKLVVGA